MCVVRLPKQRHANTTSKANKHAHQGSCGQTPRLTELRSTVSFAETHAAGCLVLLPVLCHRESRARRGKQTPRSELGKDSENRKRKRKRRAAWVDITLSQRLQEEKNGQQQHNATQHNTHLFSSLHTLMSIRLSRCRARVRHTTPPPHTAQQQQSRQQQQQLKRKLRQHNTHT
jgi:hypothetical protein